MMNISVSASCNLFAGLIEGTPNNKMADASLKGFLKGFKAFSWLEHYITLNHYWEDDKLLKIVNAAWIDDGDKQAVVVFFTNKFVDVNQYIKDNSDRIDLKNRGQEFEY